MLLATGHKIWSQNDPSHLVLDFATAFGVTNTIAKKIATEMTFANMVENGGDYLVLRWS